MVRAWRMTAVQESKMDWKYPRCHKDTMSKSRLLLVLGTMMLTTTLYPMLKMVGVQLYATLSGSYVAGHHSILLINCPTELTAKDIGRHIMEKRMAACVNIFPHTSTMYYWKGEIQDTSEVLLLVRTRTSLIQRLTEFVIAMHPYEIPEIISFPIEDGSLSYMKWMDVTVPEV